MNTIAIIMARGGSKGLPRKNVKLLAGKPLIAYTIEHAIASGVCDEVIVTTEDEEIAEIAKKYGAKVKSIWNSSHSNPPRRIVFKYRQQVPGVKIKRIDLVVFFLQNTLRIFFLPQTL